MLHPETTIVPLDAADEVFSAFGIGPYNRAYLRWRRHDGFRLVDLENESQSVLGVDWRECLQDAVTTVLSQLSSIGISANADLGEQSEARGREVETPDEIKNSLGKCWIRRGQ